MAHSRPWTGLDLVRRAGRLGACMMSEEKGHGYAGGWSESGFDASIPVWDGRADTLREFKKTVTWWLSSIDLSKTRFFNLAARLAMRQKGRWC